MRAIRKLTAEPGFELLSTIVPSPQHGEALIAVEAAGLCGTDLHIADWTPGYESMAAGLPVTLGHEFAGRVIAGASSLLNRLVVVRPSTVCVDCNACGAMRHDHCSKRRGIGIHRDGGFSSFVAVPEENCLVIDNGLDAEVAALAEPLTVAMEAVRRSGLKQGENLLIIGPGPIGALTALAAEDLMPRSIAVVGRDDGLRLNQLQQLGIGHVFDIAKGELSDELASAGLPQRFDRVVEASGSAAAVELGLKHLMPGGVLTIAGIHARPVAIDLTALVRSNQDVRGSYRAPVSVWPEALSLLSRQPERFRRLITHRFNFDNATEAFAAMRRREAMKVIFKPEALPS
jgi:threonine 3-dehydrogenase